jgi:hypothetical protein
LSLPSSISRFASCQEVNRTVRPQSWLGERRDGGSGKSINDSLIMQTVTSERCCGD